jgi:hypothetical protein
MAVCGATIVPAPMASPVGRYCADCAAKIGYLTWDGSRTQPRIRHRRLPVIPTHRFSTYIARIQACISARSDRSTDSYDWFR